MNQYPPPQVPPQPYGQPPYGQPPYGQPPYGQAPHGQPAGAPGVGPQGAGYPTEPIASMAKPTVALLGLRAALPVLVWLMYFVVTPSRGLAFGVDALKGLGSLVAIIFFFVWFARTYSWIRATRGGTRYSNGMAIGCWFIPFANFVMPYFAVRDAWRRGANDENGFLVVLWWLSYLLAIVLSVFFSLLQSSPSMGYQLFHSAPFVLTLLFWVNLLAQIGAYGLLLLLVQGLTRRATGGR